MIPVAAGQRGRCEERIDDGLLTRLNRRLEEIVNRHPAIQHDLRLHRRCLGLVGDTERFRRREYDLVFDLQCLLRSALMSFATGATLRVGLETAREGAQWLTHGLIPQTGFDVPAHQRITHLAEFLTGQPSPAVAEFQIDPAVRASAQALLPLTGRPLLAIHCGAMWITKRWPVESFAEVASRAVQRYGFQVAVVGSPGERADAERLCQMIQERCGSAAAFSLAGQTSLQQLTVILQQADLVLTNDSGPMHLAAGVGTPVVGLFTCTSAVRSGPADSRHELVQAQVPCAASYRKQCPHTGQQHMHCLQALSVFQAWSALQRAVEKNHLCQRVA